MLRFPSARGPNSMRPCIHAMILCSPSIAHRGRQQFVGRSQIVEAQLAVLQHLLDLFGAVAGAEAAGRPRVARSPRSEDVMPGIQHRAQRRARVARRRLHEDILPSVPSARDSTSSALKNNPPATHRFSPSPASSQYGFLDRLLQPRAMAAAVDSGICGAVLKAESRVEFCAESARRRCGWRRKTTESSRAPSQTISANSPAKRSSPEPWTATAPCVHPRRRETRAARSPRHRDRPSESG